LIGLGLGILSGILFGEKTAFLKIAGDAFIQLLQMTVLPYVVVSLIGGLGSLSYERAVELAKKCGLLLVVLWAIGLLMVLAMPLAFPEWESASYFSTSLIQPTPAFDFLGLYIPSNLFRSLSNNIVPAVVVFSLAFGIALIGYHDKEIILRVFAAATEVLGRITTFLVHTLAPFGVFAIMASAIGSMRFADLERLQVYLLTYVVTSLLLTFWILPGLVTALTPLRYADLIGPTRAALVTAFATGNIFVVLPVLSERSKDLVRGLGGNTQEGESTVDIVIPTSFSFPNLGKILTLSFVLFAGWFSDSAVAVSKYLTFAFTGLFSFFGDPTVAIPFLLDLLRIPADTFRFFLVVDNLVGTRFGTLLAAMYTLVLAVLGACSVSGLMRVRWPQLGRFAAITVVLTLGALGGTRLWFERVVRHEYRESIVFTHKDLLHHQPPATVHKSELPAPPAHDPLKSRLLEIRDRGYIRVGYLEDALPFAYENQAGKLVGFDVEMAYRLAQEMKVSLELVQIDRAKSDATLNDGYVDVIMSGLVVTLDRAQDTTLSNSYLDQTLAFIVRDHRREEFSSRSAVQKLQKVRVGVPNAPYYMTKIREYLPHADLVVLDSPRQFFSGDKGDLDAMAYSAEAGSAWTLIHPAYAVAIPRPDILAVPSAYAVARGERELIAFLNTWIELKKKDQTVEALYDHWILGRSRAAVEPRWSVIRNVLHLLPPI
jgi:Na+/H+-dicarboxylate symporter